MITVAQIKTVVCEHYDLPAETMNTPMSYGFGRNGRNRLAISHPRQEAMYLAKALTRHSFARLGYFFHRDHTTIMHGISAVEKRLKSDERVAENVEELKRRLSVDNSNVPALADEAAGA